MLGKWLIFCAFCLGCSSSDSGGAGTGNGGTNSGGAGAGGAGGSVAAGGSAGSGDPTDSGTGGAAASDAGSAACPTSGPPLGFSVGNRLAGIVVKSCDGADYSLDSLCGASGLWILAAHGWCPLCKSVSEQQEAFHDQWAGKGLASVTVIVEDAQSNPPDADYCKLWRETYGHEDVLTLYDPTGSVLALWPNGSSSLHAFVDADRVIVSKLEHTSDMTAIQAEIEMLVGPP